MSDYPFTVGERVPRAVGRRVMFSCRLNDKEAEALDSLLALVEGDSIQSERFRSIILELNGCLSRDYLHHIRYRDPNMKAMQSSNVKRSDKSQEWFDRINNLRFSH